MAAFVALPYQFTERIAVVTSSPENGMIMRRRRFPRTGDKIQRAFRVIYDPLDPNDLMSVLLATYGTSDYGTVPFDFDMPGFGTLSVRTQGRPQWEHVSRRHIRLTVDLIEEPRPYA